MRKTVILFVVLLLGYVIQASAIVKTQSVRVDLDMNNASLTQVLWELEKKTDIVFFYSVDDVASVRGLNLRYKNATLSEILDKLLKNTNLAYEIKNETVVIRLKKTVERAAPPIAKRTIKGMVRDQDGEPLPGVSVLVKGTNTGVATDMSGYFELQIDNIPNVVLQFSFVGMRPQERKVGDKNSLTIVLLPMEESLGEVIITGYQTISKERATGAFSVISPKDIENKLQTNIMDRLEGQVAGLVQYNGNVNIRGISTVYGNKNPIYVVDGMPYEGDLSAINPSDIQNVTVLKDATAASIYGARAANGVIVITTKSGQTGKTKVRYDGSVAFQPLPDVDYLKLMNSEELVNLKYDLFNYYHAEYSALNKRASIDEVTELFYLRKNGTLTENELQNRLGTYRFRDRREQVEDELLRTSLTHQHNLALSGGSDKYTYMASVNYLGRKPYNKAQNSEQFGFNLKNNIKFFEWFNTDIGIVGNFTNTDGSNGISGTSLRTSGPSYQMLRNDDGTPAVWRNGRSDYELDRLQSLGLYDLTYRPLDELDKTTYKTKSAYYKINVGLKFDIMKGLNVHLTYQTENSNSKSHTFRKADSYYVRDMVVNAAQVDKETGAITYNVPEGNQITETRGDMSAYTMRAQVNFNRTIKEKHAIVALLGAERRAVKNTASSAFRMGFDENTLGYKPADIKQLGIGLKGTESLNGTFSWQDKNYNKFTETEDRYVSFYGNASYTYNDRYAATASIRIDQSNLFGTDPKYQWKPLWSVGGSWFMSKEDFLKDVNWLDRLSLRLTYGINGNVSKQSSPFLIIQDMGYSDWKQGFSSSIKSSPNPSLRWERTAVTNIGLDFSFFRNRLSGSFDFYNRKSTDLLGEVQVDITKGTTVLWLNYGSMKNRGIELTLNSINFETKNFQWSTGVNFSYNKNEVIDITNRTTTAATYAHSLINVADRPMYSLFSYRWAGLDPKNGDPRVYDKNGNIVTSSNDVENMVYSGTTRPPYSASMTNTFNYKGIGLSFMFIYNGGHVIRDEAAEYLGSSVSSNIYRGALNYWKQPGDENISGMAPAANRLATSSKKLLWYAADIHIMKADYIKLRDITLSYNFPKKWLSKVKLENMTVKAQARNLWWWAANDSGIDPEAYSFSAGATGMGRGHRTVQDAPTYTLGLSFNF